MRFFLGALLGCFLVALNTSAYAKDMIKLTPKIRVKETSSIIYTIQRKDIDYFFENLLFVYDQDFSNSPKVIGLDKSGITATTGDLVYVEGELDKNISRFNYIQIKDKYFDPVSKEYLGQMIDLVGNLELTGKNKFYQLKVVSSKDVLSIGDHVIPAQEFKLPDVIEARYPENAIEAKIISLLRYSSSGSLYDTVIINLGSRDQVTIGNLLDVIGKGVVQTDRKNNKSDAIVMPNKKIGEVLIYRVFNKISLGLVLKAIEPIEVFDTVKS